MKFSRCLLLLSFGLFLYGDVMYEMVTTTEGMMGGGGETTMRVFIKGDRSMTEINSKSPMVGELTQISIVRLDKGVAWMLDMENKEYSEVDFKEEMKFEETEEETVKPELKVVKTDKHKKILNKDCEEVVVSMTAKDDDGGMKFTQKMWVTKDIPAYQEIIDFQRRISEIGFRSSSSAMMAGDKKSYEEFQEKISEIEGFPLEINMDVEMGAEEFSFSIKTHSVVTKFDNKPINLKVFEIPEGYKLKK